MDRAPAPDPAPVLADVLNIGGMGVVDVVHAGRGLDVPVTGVGLYDAGETIDARGQILVAAGVDTSSDEAPRLLRAAARAGASALVIRRGAQGPTPRLLETAADSPAALLTRAPWIDWTEFIGMLRAALAQERGRPSSVEVPLGDLNALALALAALVGGALTIEDPESRVLAHSPTDGTADPLRRLTILGGKVPEWRLAELTESGFLGTLWATPDVVHRPADDRFPERLAIAVRAGGEVLGSLWAAADGAPLPPHARDALREAARTAVPHLLHHRLRTRSAAARRGQAVRALLDGHPDVPAAAAALGLAPDTACAVVTATVRESEGGLDRAFHLASLRAATLPQTLGLARPGGTPTPPAFPHRDGDRLDVLVPAPRATSEPGTGPSPAGAGKPRADREGQSDPLAAAARRLGAELAAVLRGAGFTPYVAVGPAVPVLSDAPRSRAAAALILRVLRAKGGPDAADAADVRPALDALRVTDAVAALTPSVTDATRDLLAYDAEHRTDLPRTLAVHLTRFGDVAAASRDLGIHPNTLRYRLRRVRELFGLDLDDPDIRLLTELGLRHAGLIPPPPPV
ncbi:PucR family transcriptional regulator [Streptomyces sp. NPDC002577]